MSEVRKHYIKILKELQQEGDGDILKTADTALGVLFIEYLLRKPALVRSYVLGTLVSLSPLPMTDEIAAGRVTPSELEHLRTLSHDQGSLQEVIDFLRYGTSKANLDRLDELFLELQREATPKRYCLEGFADRAEVLQESLDEIRREIERLRPDLSPEEPPRVDGEGVVDEALRKAAVVQGFLEIDHVDRDPEWLAGVFWKCVADLKQQAERLEQLYKSVDGVGA